MSGNSAGSGRVSCCCWGSAPFCFALVTGLRMWRSEGWVLLDWIAWNVLLVFVYWPFFLVGFLLMGLAGVIVWETKQQESDAWGESRRGDP